MKLTLVTNQIYEKLQDPEAYLSNYDMDPEEIVTPEYPLARVELQRAAFTFQGDSTPLPLPFKSVTSVFSRHGNFYSGLLQFMIDKKFLESSKKIEELLEKSYGDKWTSLCLPCRGYIANDKKEVSVVVMGREEQFNIAIGSYGARPLQMESEEEFLGDIGTLESVANKFMNSWFDSVDLQNPPKNDLEVYVRI